MSDEKDMNKKGLRRIKARTVEIRKVTNLGKASNDKAGKSTSVNDDPLYTLSESGKIIEPPYDPLSLTLLLENNTELNQCIEVMEVNIDSFGHRFVSRLKNKPDLPIPKKMLNAVNKEKVFLENFFSYCTRESFVKFRRKLRKDLEVTGVCFFEVIRSASGKIQKFVHLPSYQMRLGRMDKEFQKTTRPVYELQEDGSVKIVNLDEFIRFRTYVQSRNIRRQNLDVITGDQIRWYKEFGDERIYDNTTGKVDQNTPIEKRANEVIYVDLYSARSPYGLPRFIGNLLSIFGDRAAEEINYVTFKNNNIPSMVVLCSNGQLTEGSFSAIESFVESQIQGSENYSKFLILEAEGDMEGEDGGQAKIDVKPLVSEQHKDALFQKYSANNKDNVRRAFRIPPIFLGQAEEYNKATADTSRRLGDEQVFAPERQEFDELMNRYILPELGIIYHKYVSNSPNTTDNEQLVTMLATSEKTGGMTPFIARWILEEILGRDLPDFPDDFDQHRAFSLTMAEAVKNKADPTEPGQQVTAIKSTTVEFLLDTLRKALGERDDDPLIDRLLAIQKATEDEWSKDLEEEHDHEEE